MATDGRTCETCRWFDRNDSPRSAFEKESGLCLRYPPIVVAGCASAMRPELHMSETCGEWAAKTTEPRSVCPKCEHFASMVPGSQCLLGRTDRLDTPDGCSEFSEVAP